LFRVSLVLLILVTVCAAPAAAQQASAKIKLFLLAGQSNMEGKGSVMVMNHQLTLPEKRAKFARYKDGIAFGQAMIDLIER
jgi:hypothetical protein